MVPQLAKRVRRRLFWPPEVPQRFRPAFRALEPGAVAIDAGANVGLYTVPMAERGAVVYAFEPNPWAYAVLAERFARTPNVRSIRSAVSDRDGTARLYLHEDARVDPLAASVGSSLVAGKGNVRVETYVEVETVSLEAFVTSLGHRVALLKLDVEGAEIPILTQLLDTGRIAEIDNILVEMHDRRVSELRAAGAELRRRLSAHPNVRLDWD
jgi:FkbM family methyltransferase